MPQNANEWVCAIGLLIIVVMLCAGIWGTMMDKTPGCDDIYEF